MGIGDFLATTASTWKRVLRAPRGSDGIAVLATVWEHHARVSGYQPVAKGLGLALPADEGQLRVIPRRLSSSLKGAGMDRAHQIVLAMRLARCDKLLVIDGDHDLELMSQIKRISNFTVCGVFHQVEENLRRCLDAAAQVEVDLAICVADCLREILGEFMPIERTCFLPHGIDTEYFSALDQKPPSEVALCVGVHQRDFATLRAVASQMKAAAGPGVVRLVASTRALPADFEPGDIELRTDLDDEELRAEYQNAAVLLMPLLAATANNSILEAMACGLPVVATDLPGVRDYLGPKEALLVPGVDPGAMVAAVQGLLADRQRLGAMGLAVRDKAEQFSWPRVREMVRAQIAAAATSR